MEIKHATEQQIGSTKRSRNTETNENENMTTKIYGCSKSETMRGVYNHTGLLQEERKISTKKNLMLYLDKLGEITSKAQSQYKEGNNKNQNK